MVRNEANEKCQLIEYTMQNQIIYVKISPLPKIQHCVVLFVLVHRAITICLKRDFFPTGNYV